MLYLKYRYGVYFPWRVCYHLLAHRDSEPGKALAVAQSISFAPHLGDRRKRFYVCDRAQGNKSVVTAPIYWFNDMDYHGVEPDPFFRYSIRVDGVFENGFVETVRKAQSGPAR